MLKFTTERKQVCSSRGKSESRRDQRRKPSTKFYYKAYKKKWEIAGLRYGVTVESIIFWLRWGAGEVFRLFVCFALFKRWKYVGRLSQ